MPRPPHRNFDVTRHQMGDHVLFHNASTAKRFPLLAAVPQTELAEMFNVPMVDRAREKDEELMYFEPHQEKVFSFRESKLADGKPPFVPTNASTAKKSIGLEPEAIYTGPPAAEDELSQRREQAARSRTQQVCEKPFAVRSASKAQDLVSKQLDRPVRKRIKGAQ